MSNIMIRTLEKNQTRIDNNKINIMKLDFKTKQKYEFIY